MMFSLTSQRQYKARRRRRRVRDGYLAWRGRLVAKGDCFDFESSARFPRLTNSFSISIENLLYDSSSRSMAQVFIVRVNNCSIESQNSEPISGLVYQYSCRLYSTSS